LWCVGHGPFCASIKAHCLLHAKEEQGFFEAEILSIICPFLAYYINSLGFKIV